jgi:hypothetical protein
LLFIVLKELRWVSIDVGNNNIFICNFFIDFAPKLPDGIFRNRKQTVCANDPFFNTPFLTRLWRVQNAPIQEAVVISLYFCVWAIVSLQQMMGFV